jgi:hypothetical protein
MKRLASIACALGSVFLAVILTACGGSYKGTINYVAPPDSPAETERCTQPITVLPFTDARPYHDIYVNRVGELKGGFGEVFRSVDLKDSVSLETSKAFASFLKDKGCLVSSGQPEVKDGVTLSGTLNDFFGVVFWVIKIGIDVDLKLTDNATGKESVSVNIVVVFK